MRLLSEIRNLLDNYHVKSGIYHYYRGEYGPAADFFRKALDGGEDLTGSDRRSARYYLTMTLTESAERREAKTVQRRAVAGARSRERLRHARVYPRLVDQSVEPARAAVPSVPPSLAAGDSRRPARCSERF